MHGETVKNNTWVELSILV